MPSGRTHDRITLWGLPLVAGLTLTLTRQSALTFFVCAGFLFGGLMLGPDLDIHSVHYKRWGWLRWIWLPYRGSLRHRSPWSHAPITGTTVRVIYLLAWLGMGVFGTIAIINEILQLGWTWGDIGQFLTQNIRKHKLETIALCIGLELGAFSHYTADWLVSSHKRYKTKGWQAILPRPSKSKKRKACKSSGKSQAKSKRNSNSVPNSVPKRTEDSDSSTAKPPSKP